MKCHGEPVGFVANLLHQSQRRRLCRQGDAFNAIASKQQLFLFRPVDHYKRFLASTKIMVMELGFDIEGLLKLTIDLLHHEGHREDVYVRPLAYKADEAIGVKLHGLIDELTIFAPVLPGHQTSLAC